MNNTPEAQARIKELREQCELARKNGEAALAGWWLEVGEEPNQFVQLSSATYAVYHNLHNVGGPGSEVIKAARKVLVGLHSLIKKLARVGATECPSCKQTVESGFVNDEHHCCLCGGNHEEPLICELPLRK